MRFVIYLAIMMVFFSVLRASGCSSATKKRV